MRSNTSRPSRDSLERPTVNKRIPNGPSMDPSVSGTGGAGREPERRRYVRILCLVCFLSALLDFSAFINMAPQTEITEQIICRNYYRQPDSPLDALDCKQEAIQTELALVQEMRPALGQIPGILLALPFGVMADQYGRKAVFLLFLLGLFLSDTWVKIVYLFPDIFPIRLVWLAPFIQVIGGGGQVGDFVICTVIADVVPSQERVRAFLKLTAMDLIAQIAATPTAAAMMRQNLWYPLVLSSFLLVSIALLSLRLPDTRPGVLYGLLSGGDDEELETSEPRYRHQTGKQPLLKEYRRFFASMKLMSTGPIVVLLFVFSLACFGTQSLQLILQYASKKFEWDYAQASLLMTVRSIFHLALATVLMPLADTYITRRRGLPAKEKDMMLTQLSGVLLIVGHLILFLANNPAGLAFGLMATALGSTFLVTLRSTMTSLVPATSVGVLYTSSSIAHGVGVMVAGPLVSLIYHWGMVLGDGWLGLPFLATSILHLLALMAMVYSTRMMGYKSIILTHFTP